MLLLTVVMQKHNKQEKVLIEIVSDLFVFSVTAF